MRASRLLPGPALTARSLVKDNKVKPVVYEEIFEGLPSVPAAIDGARSASVSPPALIGLLAAVTKRKTYGKAVVRLRKDAESAKL